MTNRWLLAVAALIAMVGPVHATIYWADTAGSNSAACTSIDSTDPQDDPGTYGTIGRAANCATVAGDMVFVRPGTYTSANHKIDTETTTPNFASGTSDTVRTIITGVPGQTRPEIRVTSPFIQFRGNLVANTRDYVTIENMNVTDTSVGSGGSCVLQIIGSHILVQHMHLADAWSEAICTHRADVVPAPTGLRINDLRITNPGRDGLGYSLYNSGTDDVIVENSYLEGLQQVLQFTSSVPGQFPKRPTIRNNHLKGLSHNGLCNGVASEAPGTVVYNNIFEGCTGGTNGAAIVIGYNGDQGQSLDAYNNVIFGWSASGIQVGLFRTVGTTTANIKNNYFYNNGNGTSTACYQTFNATSVTITHNAAVSGSTCGTSSVAITALTTCLVSTTDFRLKAGTNTCRNAGTTVSTRPSPVGASDIGAYEHGSIASATVAGSIIEVTVSVMTPSIQPTSGITGFTINNGTSTGTPVVTAAVLKAGSTNVVQLSVSGFTAPGTCTISYTAGNLTDSGYINEISLGLSQLVNTASGVSVSGTCANTTGDPAPPPTGLYSEFLLDDGSGTTAADSSGNVNNGTVSAGVTWVTGTGILSTGVYVPTVEEAGDSTYRHVASTHGQGVDPSANSLSYCILASVSTTYSQKIVGSSGDYTSNRRAYVGVTTINGARYWAQGVQDSTFFGSGATEFPAVSGSPTLVCQRFNAATDVANLSVNRTIGTSAATNKTYTTYTLADDIRAGNDGTFTVNTGGMTIYAMWVWSNTYISDADVQSLYDSIFPAGGSVGCYAQKAHRWQRVHLDGTTGGNPLAISTDASIEVVEGGAVALEMQVDCTGATGAPLSVRLHVTDIAGNTSAVPQAVGSLQVGMYGDSTSPILNRFASTCCITGALTPINGVTILNSVATETITQAQDSSQTFRWLLRAGTAPKTLFFFLKQDNGAALDGPAGTTPSLQIIPVQASSGG